MLKLDTGELVGYYDGIFIYAFDPSTNMHLKRKPSKEERERIIKVKDKSNIMSKKPELDGPEFKEDYERSQEQERLMQVRYDQL